MKHLLTAALSISFLFSGCKGKKDLANKETVKEDINESVDDMMSMFDETVPEKIPARSRYNPSETRKHDLLHTKLAVSFDWGKHHLNGKATLDLKPYFYPQQYLMLDAKGMDIHKVALVNNKALQDLKYEYDGMVLNIDLGRLFKKEEQYKVYIEYTAKPDEYEMGGSSAIAGDKGLYFINSDSTEVDKPTQIWTQGETEASSRWFPTIDAPNEKMTQELEITVPKQYKTLSNGLLMFSTENPDGTRTDFWKQALPHSPYLVMMAIGDFAVVTDHWTRADGKKLEVSYYVEKEYAPYARDIFGETPKMIGFFSDLLGVEYQWDKYSQVVVRDYVSGAMENTSATIHGEFLLRTRRELLDEHNESIIAHELFHHWFGDLVTCESWANLPLNESFANYSQYLWDEFRHGRDEAEYNASVEMSNYKLSAEQTGHVQMIRYGYKDKDEMFDAHSYNKGGRILHMLRKYVGDEAFFASLKKYLEDNKFKAAEIHHLRLAFERVTGEDLNWFFDEWFLAKGHPQLYFRYERDTIHNNLLLITEQKHNFDQFPVYKLPVPVDVYAGRSKTRHDIWVDAVVDTTIIPFTGKPDLINFDAEHALVADIDYEKSTEEYVYQYFNAPLYQDRYEALMHCRRKSDPEAINVVVKALNDPFWKIRETALTNLRRAVTVHKDEIREKVLDIAKNDPHSGVRSNALIVLEKNFSDSPGLETVFVNALKDSSYLVMGVALQSLADLNMDKAYQLAKGLENEKSSSLKTALGDIYAEQGKPEDNDFYMNNWTEVGGFEKISFLKTYARYLKKQDDDLVFKGLEVFEEVAKNGGVMWVKYFAGYQTILEFRKHYQEEVESTRNRIARLESEGNSSELALAQRDLETYKTNYDRVNKMIGDLLAQEQDQQIKDFVEAGASMEIIHEEKEE